MSSSRFRNMDYYVRTSLQGVGSNRPDVHEVKRQGWQEQGILVIDVNHGSLTNAERNFIENIGTKFYGRRPINGR